MLIFIERSLSVALLPSFHIHRGSGSCPIIGSVWLPSLIEILKQRNCHVIVSAAVASVAITKFFLLAHFFRNAQALSRYCRSKRVNHVLLTINDEDDKRSAGQSYCQRKADEVNH